MLVSGTAGVLTKRDEVVTDLADPRDELMRLLAAQAPIGVVLNYLVGAIQARAPRMTASVLRVEDGLLKYGAAPGLPEGYNRAADNHPIGEGYGSCGTAAHRGELVIVDDIATDPLWKNYRDIARRYHLGACWSMPIFDAARTVIGTFALYYPDPRRPRPEEIDLIRQFAGMAAVALVQHRTRKALGESERHFAELIDDIDAVVWQATPDMRRFTSISPRAAELFGHPLAAFFQDGFWAQQIHPEDRAVTLARLAALAGRPGQHELEYRVLRGDGGVVWLRVRARAEHDPEASAAGTVQRLRGVMTNISRQREAEAQGEETFARWRAQGQSPRDASTPPASDEASGRNAVAASLLAEASSLLGSSLDVGETARTVASLATRNFAEACLVFLRATDGVLTCAALVHRDPANPVSADELTRLLPQPGGMPFGLRALLAGGGVQRLPDLGLGALESGAARSELARLLRRLGNGVSLAVPMQLPSGLLGAIVYLFSAAAGSPDEGDPPVAELIARRAALALENARLYHEARRAIAQREEFLSVAAHELKTPLASLQLTMQGIEMAIDAAPIDSDFLRARAQAGVRQATRLGRLIHDLLDVSVIHAGRLRLQPESMDLSAAVEAALGRLRDDVTRRQIDVTVHAPAPVTGCWDPMRIDQVITNLLTNALKYGDGRPVHVRVSESGSLALLEVDDEGIGMSSELLERIFKPFERGVSAGHYGGLGLGLYITGQIVRAHGGNISVRSTPAAGSSFRIELPR